MSDSIRYFWLRLYDDFFKSKRIKKLRKMAGGDTYTIIYLEMQLLAMKTNGVLTWTGLEDDFVDELSLDLDENAEDIRVTLAYLLHCGLAETSDNANFFLPYAVANVGSETSSAQRVREYREKQKVLHCNTNVTELKQVGNAEIEKEIEKEKKIENNTIVPAPKTPQINYSEIMDNFNSICIDIPKIKTLTDSRKQAIKNIQKIAEDIGGFTKIFAMVQESDFLTGRKGDWNGCSFDWIIKKTNLVKIAEGNYKNNTKKNVEGKNWGATDLDAFEKMLNSKDRFGG